MLVPYYGVHRSSTYISTQTYTSGGEDGCTDATQCTNAHTHTHTHTQHPRANTTRHTVYGIPNTHYLRTHTHTHAHAHTPSTHT